MADSVDSEDPPLLPCLSGGYWIEFIITKGALGLQWNDMRSDHVFAAVKEISNRFLLCRVTSVSVRRLHIDSRQPSETINRSLKLIAAGDLGKSSGDASNQSSLPQGRVAGAGSS